MSSNDLYKKMLIHHVGKDLVVLTLQLLHNLIKNNVENRNQFV